MRKLFFLILASSAALVAQPRITRVANGGSLMQASLAGGSIARGSIFAIMGRNFGPSTLAIATTYPLSTSLAGIAVKVTKGTASVDALPYATITGQVNVIMPITVNGNSRSNPFPARVVNSSFGIYTANSGGFGPGILQNFNGPTDVP